MYEFDFFCLVSDEMDENTCLWSLFKPLLWQFNGAAPLTEFKMGFFVVWEEAQWFKSAHHKHMKEPYSKIQDVERTDVCVKIWQMKWKQKYNREKK